MPGMWELPAVEAKDAASGAVLFTLRHAIMNTGYVVRVVRLPAEQVMVTNQSAQWVAASRAQKLPQTGLAKKILHRTIKG